MNTAFKSNLLRMEMDEMLGRILRDTSADDGIKQSLLRLKVALEKSSSCRVSFDETTASLFPLYPVSDNKTKLAFAAPSRVSVVGSLLFNATLHHQSSSFDMAVEMPESCLKAPKKSDTTAAEAWLRQYRYHDLRVLYLSRLAQQLQQQEGWDVESETALSGDVRKPVLVVHVTNGKNSDVRYKVRIFPTFSDESSTASLQSSNWLPHVQNTPFFNASVVEDSQMIQHAELVFSCSKQCPALRGAIALAKEWLRLVHAPPSFGSFQVTMLLCFLYLSDQFPNAADLQTIFRVLLAFLSEGSLFSKGLFWPGENAAPDAVKSLFTSSFDVVFVDRSGLVNLTSRMTKLEFLELKELALVALTAMDNNQGFVSFFDDAPDFEYRWDQLVMLSDVVNSDTIQGKIRETFSEDFIEYFGWELAAILSMVDLLQRGLGNRCLQTGFRGTAKKGCIGVRFDASNAFKKLDAGPQADDKENASAFRKFWGPRSELRRFKDGSIIEAVVWEVPFEQRMNIPGMVMSFLLQHHFGVTTARTVGAELDNLILVNSPMLPQAVSGDQLSLHLLSVYQEVAEKIRSLERVPLIVTEVLGLSSDLRSCEVFPAMQSALTAGTAQGDSLYPLAVPVVKIAAHYMQSNAWPTDKEAHARMCQAFFIRTHEELARKFQVESLVRYDCLDILYGGFVFRMTMVTGKEKLETRRRNLRLGWFTTAISGFHMKHNAYGSCVRLCKRWLNAHLLSGRYKDELVELMVAYVFGKSFYPFVAPPATPMMGFLRWLYLLSSYPWGTEPLVVSVSGEALDETFIQDGRDKMRHRKEKFGGIVVPFVIFDMDNTSACTDKLPKGNIWKRIVTLARYAFQVGLSAPLDLFVHNFDDYNMVIECDTLNADPKGWQNIRIALSGMARPPAPTGPSSKVWTISNPKRYRRDHSLLMCNFDPVRAFVKELEERYGSIATFFFDSCGGDRIGVLLLNDALTRHKEPSSSVSVMCMQPSKSDPNQVTFNLEQFVADIREMGQGLVNGIKLRA